MSDFPEFVCPYAERLAKRSRRFALQCYELGNCSIRRFVDSSIDSTIRPFDDSKTSPSPGQRTSCPLQKNFSSDPFGELTHASKCHGLRQRFPDRVLIMTANRCFMNCRHCTRRGILGRSEIVRTADELARCVEYVKRHVKVRDVLLSGGDILTLSDDRVLRFVRAFAGLRQVDLVRVCTRALAANPLRVTDALAEGLAKSKKVWVNTQFNCADEVTSEAVCAAARLIDRGIPVSCQTVLLRGVNDSGAEMLRLLRALSAARIRPYYVFQCDPVAGIDRFRVSLDRAKEIERYCAERIGGLSLPRFVADLPTARRKLPLDLL